MKRYKYRAKRGLDEVVEGTLLAETVDSVVDQINEMGLLPIDVKEERATKAKSKRAHLIRLKRVSSRELVVLYRQLARLVKAGIPILRALGLVIEQSDNDYLKEVLTYVQNAVREGGALSSALNRYPNVFGELDIAMIEAGESVGKINESLVRVAFYREQQNTFRSKVNTALAYPAFLILCGTITVIFIIGYVIPKFSRFFLDLGQNLPIPTRILIHASQVVQNGWLWFLGCLILVVFLISRIYRNHRQRLVIDRFLLNVPGLGSMIVRSEIARISRTLELLIRSGTPLLNAMKIAVPVISNQWIRKDMEDCCKVLEDGGLMSEGLRRSPYLPTIIPQLLGIGEETGRIEEAFMEVADWYEQELEENIKRLTGLLEPVIILIIGLILGVIVISVLLPVFSINTLVQ